MGTCKGKNPADQDVDIPSYGLGLYLLSPGKPKSGKHLVGWHQKGFIVREGVNKAFKLGL